MIRLPFMAFDDQNTTEFFPIWKKYKPVITKLMKDSLDDAQTYQLYGHEFADVNTKSTSTYSFKITLDNGRVTNVKKPSKMANDLLSMIKLSPSARELMEQHIFKIDLDSNFQLSIKCEARTATEKKEEDTE
jgi:hypothetical protein